MIYYLYVQQEIRNVDRPQVIGYFFANSNSIDTHNHIRQFELALEKKWITQDAYFRLTTTKVGMDATDSWMLMNHHNLFPYFVSNRYSVTNQRKVPMKAYAGILSGQLIELAKKMEEEEVERSSRRREDIAMDDNGAGLGEDLDTSMNDHDVQRNVTITYDNGKGKIINNCIYIRDNYDGNGKNHGLAKFPVIVTKNNRRRAMSKQCDRCKKLTTCFCTRCMKPLCHSLSNIHSRKCFIDHISNRTSPRNTNS